MFTYKRLFILFLFSTLSIALQAQILSTADRIISHKGKDIMSIEVKMDPPTKEVKDALDDFMKETYDVNLKGFGFLANKDVLEAEEVKLVLVSEKAFNLYFKVIESVNATQVNAFASFGYDVPFDPTTHPEAFEALRRIVYRFLDDFLPNYYAEKVKETRTYITDLKDEQEKLAKNIEDNTEEIAKLKDENEDLRAKRFDNITALEQAAQKLEQEKIKLTRIRSLLPETDIEK